MDFEPKSLEEWEEIPGFEGRYEVSNYGNVASVTRTFQGYRKGTLCNITITGRILAQTTCKRNSNRGAQKISITNDNGKLFTFYVGNLVLTMFGEKPDDSAKDQCFHIDGNKKNNHISNLKWTTHDEAISLAISMGLKKDKSFLSHKAKLKKEEVEEIRNSAMTVKELSLKYRVGQNAIYNLLRRKTYY